MKSSKNCFAGALVGALLIAGLAGCSTTPDARPSAATSPSETTASATPEPDDWYELEDGTQIDIVAGEPLPEVILDDARAALQQAAAEIGAAGLPADGTGATPEQMLPARDAVAKAGALQSRLSDLTGRTVFVVYPEFASMDGENYTTVWTVTPWMEEHSVMSSIDKDTVVAGITQWVEQAGPEYLVVAP